MTLSAEVSEVQHDVSTYVCIKVAISLELCHNNLLCSHWQSSHHSYAEDVPNRVFDCSLLSSCDLQHIGNTTYPTVTNSGSRICLPDPFKRRPCSGCPGKKKGQRRFCHGRCVNNNIPGAARCLFGVCSASPYREDAGATCSELAIEAEEDECSGQCEDISTNTGSDSCQSCIVDHIDPSCQDVSGAACWYCGGAILEKLGQCATASNVGGTISSKNYPEHYDNSDDEEWTLEAPEGHIIQLIFKSFDVEAHSSCGYDWVEVSYGSYSEKFCGSSSPEPFTSSGKNMTVRFHTDSSVVASGFSAVWTEVLGQGGVPTQPSNFSRPASSVSPADSFTNQEGKPTTLSSLQIHVYSLVES